MAKEKVRTEAVWSTGRLVFGLFAIVLFVLIAFQSCAAGLSNALEENDSFSGSSGLFLAVFMLIGGITGIATRNSEKKGGPIAAGIIFIVGALLGATSWNSDYGDLKIWTIVSLLFAVFYILCAIKAKRRAPVLTDQKEGETE